MLTKHLKILYYTFELRFFFLISIQIEMEIRISNETNVHEHYQKQVFKS